MLSIAPRQIIYLIPVGPKMKSLVSAHIRASNYRMYPNFSCNLVYNKHDLHFFIKKTMISQLLNIFLDIVEQCFYVLW